MPLGTYFFALQGEQAFLALHGLQAAFALQGLHGLQAAFALQGLHAALHAASWIAFSGISAAETAIGTWVTVAASAATLNVVKVFLSIKSS